jgi:hypothetical protein
MTVAYTTAWGTTRRWPSHDSHDARQPALGDAHRIRSRSHLATLRDRP